MTFLGTISYANTRTGVQWNIQFSAVCAKFKGQEKQRERKRKKKSPWLFATTWRPQEGVTFNAEACW